MDNFIRTIKEATTAEIEEKKSKFIAHIYHITSKEEAENKIVEIKKKYNDARHNCFAFIVLENDQRITKMSDDGEPSGTAGEPILNVIEKNNLVNVLIIVTRYFGGILLGTGGLIRAYSNTSIKAVKKADIIQKEKGIEVKIEVSYANNENFKYYCDKNNIKINNIEYKENIFYIVELNEEKLKNIQKHNKSKKNNENSIIISCVELSRKYIEKGE